MHVDLQCSDAPVVSIIVLTADSPSMLWECLSAIERTVDRRGIPYEVIVVFQQMTQEAVDSFLQNAGGVRALRSRLNLGFGGGNNWAARYAKGRYLVFLNDDATPQYGWLESLMATARSTDPIGAVGSRIVFPDGSLQEAGSILWQDGSCYPLGRGDAAGR